MKTILFPTDFSKNSVHASRYAAMLAKLYEANLILLHVHHISMTSQNTPSSGVIDPISFDEKNALMALEVFAKKLVEISNLPSERVVQRLEYGFTSEKILETAKSVEADFIVMGTQESSDFFDKWLGTHAQEVITAAECPVFTIPKNAPIDFPQRILYAADFKQDEALATQKLLEIAKPLGASCKVVHIHENFEPNVGHIVEETISELETKFKTEDVSVQELHRGDIVEGLETYIKSYQPEIFALAIHEKSFSHGFFETSISQHFIEEVKLPLLTFRKY